MSKRPIGLAGVDPERRREISSLGGKAAPAATRTFAARPGLAVEAGRKGGQVSRFRKANVSRLAGLAQTKESGQ